MSKCSACPTITPHLESHHVVPVAYGGRKDGLQVLLCSNCHTIVTRCTENPELDHPPALARLVDVARRAKARYLAGELEARDKRPSTVLPTNPEIETYIKYLQRVFNTKSRIETIQEALRFAAKHAGKAKVV